jgi:hypothetical protein
MTKVQYITIDSKRDLTDTLYYTNFLCLDYPDEDINDDTVDAYFALIRCAFEKHFRKKNPEWIPLLDDVEQKFKSGDAMKAADSVNNLIEFVNGRPY